VYSVKAATKALIDAAIIQQYLTTFMRIFAFVTVFFVFCIQTFHLCLLY